MTVREQRSRFGAFLKQHRKGLGLSQGEVADKMGHSSGQFISNIERGVCALPVATLGKLIEYYKLNPELVVGMMVDDYRFKLESSLSEAV